MAAIVVQISRGMAPAMCIAAACESARVHDVPYVLVAGQTAAEAKTTAIIRAIDAARDLVLVEDDILASAGIWQQAIAGDAPAAYCEATCRDGRNNSYRRPNGRFVASGTVLIRLALGILLALQSAGALPLQPYEFHRDGDGIAPTALDPHGRGSDMWLWYHVTKLGIDPICMGRVQTVVTPYTQGPHRLNVPDALRIIS